MDIKMVGWMDKTNRWMVGLISNIDGWMDKKIDGWLDGWIEKKID